MGTTEPLCICMYVLLYLLYIYIYIDTVYTSNRYLVCSSLTGIFYVTPRAFPNSIWSYVPGTMVPLRHKVLTAVSGYVSIFLYSPPPPPAPLHHYQGSGRVCLALLLKYNFIQITCCVLGDFYPPNTYLSKNWSRRPGPDMGRPGKFLSK